MYRQIALEIREGALFKNNNNVFSKNSSTPSGEGTGIVLYV